MSLFTKAFPPHLAQVAAQAEDVVAKKSAALSQVWEFFAAGGIFMVFIVACSVVAIAVIVFKLLVLRTHRVIPRGMDDMLTSSGQYVAGGDTEQLLANLNACSSPLTRPAVAVFAGACSTEAAARSTAESVAREEVVRLQAGIPVLEVIITIAPLLGLLGTVSGLVNVFSTIGGAVVGEADPVLLARGIAMALNTTVAGLAVAVPTVVAHTYFSRKIERLAARMEVLLVAGIGSYFGAHERLRSE